MKYTDTIFSFPIRTYDGFTVRKNLRKEEVFLDDLDSPLEDEWVEGVMRVPVSEIQGWFDHFTSGRKIQDVAKEGFDCTIVMTNTLGDFTCNWQRKKFEEELNKFADNYNLMIDKLADEMIENKLVIKKEMPWWRKFFA